MIRYASCVWELPMPTTFRAYQPNQPLLLPPDLQEWVPPGHLAHHVSDVVDALDLTAFYAPYEGDGRRNAPYEPSMMVKVLIYAYATGTFSSRAVARKLEEDVAFRMLAAGNFPQHRTVCEFRRRHLAEFSELFVGVVQVAREMGLARFGKLSVDGTKVRANASKRKAMSHERMGKEAARLQAEIEALLTKAGMVDAEEDERWGEDFRGDELPEELQRREKRLAAIQAAKARLEAAQRGRDDERGREPGQDRNPRGGRPYKRAYGEPEPKAQSNFTDPESQIMKTSSEGFQQCYNVATVLGLADEVLDHLLGDIEVSDDAVTQGPDCLNVAGRAPQHELGLLADSQHLGLAAAGSYRHHRGLIQDDTAALDVDQRVGGAKVDRHVRGQHAKDAVEHSICFPRPGALLEPAVSLCQTLVHQPLRARSRRGPRHRQVR